MHTPNKRLYWQARGPTDIAWLQFAKTYMTDTSLGEGSAQHHSACSEGVGRAKAFRGQCQRDAYVFGWIKDLIEVTQQTRSQKYVQ